MDAEFTSLFCIYASEPLFAAFSICACHPDQAGSGHANLLCVFSTALDMHALG